MTRARNVTLRDTENDSTELILVIQKLFRTEALSMKQIKKIVCTACARFKFLRVNLTLSAQI